MPVRLEAVKTAEVALCLDPDVKVNSDIYLEQIPMKCFALRAIIDLPTWFLLFWREYSDEKQFNKLVQHCYWFVFISCCFNVCIQKNKQNWCYPWRVGSSIQMIHFNIGLWTTKLGDGSIELEICRCILLFMRMLDSLWVWYQYGPYFDHLCDFLDQVKTFHHPYTIWSLSPLKWLVVGFMLGSMPYFVAHWHYDYGHPEIMGPFTGFLATNAIAPINMYIASVVMVCPKRRLLATAMVTIGTILQYALCWELFTKAAIPYAHCVDMVMFCFTLIYLIYEWRKE